jgi:hypothetical protein
MKSSEKIKSYVEWLSAEELHYDSQNWISKLNFAKDEQRFLQNLIKDYTLDLLDAKVFNEVKPAISDLKELENEHEQLHKKVKLHENQLQIMVDDVDQLKMEEAYVKTHMNLTIEVNNYFEKYQSVKTAIFNIISSVMKNRKQKKLLKP